MMKIAVMMRAMDQDSGFRAIFEGFVENMLRLDKENTYLLLYRTTKHLGRFAPYGNAQELLVRAFSKLLWDQVTVPYVAWKHGADVIFNMKFSIPLITHCPVAMGLQEPGYWTWPEHYPWWDRSYQKVMIRLFCRKAAHMFPNSQFIREESSRFLPLPPEKLTVTYTAPHKEFHVVEDRALLEDVRRKYHLPPQFILSVTRVLNWARDNRPVWDRSKNVDAAVRAYALCRERIPHKLVIAGRNIREYLLQEGFTEADLEGVIFLGFVPREDMPNVYNLADMFVIPSFYEGCPSTLLEAMACGCAVVASETGACPDVAGGAALLADPYDPADFAAKIASVLGREELRQELKRKSLERAKFFSWEKTARLTIDGLKKAYASAHRGRPR